MYKILFIDDDVEMAQIVIALLSSVATVDHVYLRNDVKKCLENNTYDLFIVDLQLPDTHGYDVFSMIRNDTNHSGSPIMFLSGENSQQATLTGFGLGADDYLVKPIKAGTLRKKILDTLERFHSGSVSAIHRCGPLIVNMLTWQTFVAETEDNKRPVNLTPLEFRILCTLINHKNQTIERSTLIREVWGDKIAVTNRAADQNIHALIRKLHVDTEIIKIIYGTGYSLIVEEVMEIPSIGITEPSQLMHH